MNENQNKLIKIKNSDRARTFRSSYGRAVRKNIPLFIVCQIPATHTHNTHTCIHIRRKIRNKYLKNERFKSHLQYIAIRMSEVSMLIILILVLISV